MPYFVTYYDTEKQETVYTPACCYFASWRIAKRFKEEGKQIIEIYERKEVL